MQEDWQKRVQERISVKKREDIVSMDIFLDDKSISHVGIRERFIKVYGYTTKVGSIGGVFTEEKYRNRGLATRLMESSMKRIDEDEGDIMFVSGGRGLYRRLGCVNGGHILNFRVRQSDLDSFDAPQNVELLLYKEENLLNVISAYHKEPVRFHRTLEGFGRQLASGRAIWKEAEVLMIFREEEFESYVIVQKPEEGEARVGNIAEYAGVRCAIVDAMKLLFDRYNLQEAVFHVPYHDKEFDYLLRQKGLSPDSGSLPGTIKIINFPRLMERFRPYIEERLGKERTKKIRFSQEGDKSTIHFEQEKFSVDGRNLVYIVFGTHNGKEKEIIKESGEIGKILEEMFPLPFPWPGLDSY